MLEIEIPLGTRICVRKGDHYADYELVEGDACNKCGLYAYCDNGRMSEENDISFLCGRYVRSDSKDVYFKKVIKRKRKSNE